MPPPREPSTTHHAEQDIARQDIARQDIATLLLDRAVHLSYALDRIRELGARGHDQDPTALAGLTDAITILTQVRGQLINNADRLENPTHTE